MKRCLLLLTLLTLPGCDVAVAALIFSSNSDSSDDDPVPLTSGKGKKAFVYLGNIPDVAAAAIERANLVNLNGNPGPNWTELGSLTATDVFDPDASVEPFNAILIQVSSEESFSIDAIEALDANGNVVGHASGGTYASFVQPEAEILDAPDGIFAVTGAAGDVRAFIFTLWPFQVDRFRINLRGTTQPPVPGDVLAQGGGIPQFGENHLPGGMSVDANGIVYLTNTRGDIGHLTLFNVGALVFPTATDFSALSSVQIAPNLAAAGSHSVVANSTGGYTACSITTGIIRVQRWDVPNLANPPVAGTFRDFNSTFSGDRVEPNGIALDSLGNVVVVGGWGSTLSGRNHFRVKIPATVTGTPIWQSPVPAPALDGSSVTYWHGVTTVGEDTLMTGDLFSG